MCAVKIFAVVNSAQAEIAFHMRLHAMRLSLWDFLFVTLILLWPYRPLQLLRMMLSDFRGAEYSNSSLGMQSPGPLFK